MISYPNNGEPNGEEHGKSNGHCYINVCIYRAFLERGVSWGY